MGRTFLSEVGMILGVLILLTAIAVPSVLAHRGGDGLIESVGKTRLEDTTNTRSISAHGAISSPPALSSRRRLLASRALLQQNANSTGDVNLSFCTFSGSDEIALAGNAGIVNGQLQLPKIDTSCSNCVGAIGSARYNQTVKLVQVSSAGVCQAASFSTAFQFEINVTKGIGADGFTFFVAADMPTTFASGGTLGYCTHAAPSKPSFAIEFDTWNNTIFNDSGYNHIGLDLNRSCNSTAHIAAPLKLNDGSVRHVWIDYDGANNTIGVFISANNTKPSAPTLDTSLDLCTFFGQDLPLYLGFSGGVGAIQEAHNIQAWAFRSSFQQQDLASSNLSVSSPCPPPPPPPPSPPPSPTPPPPPSEVIFFKRSSSGVPGYVYGVIGGVGGLLALTGLFLCLCCRSRARSKMTRQTSLDRIMVEESVRPLALPVLVEATSNFSEENLLGSGGFGLVYKGVGPKGQLWAVKKARRPSAEGMEEFNKEVQTISKMAHSNILALRAYCTEGGSQILVYDFMPNGTLHSRLSGKDGMPALTFEQRLEIAVGAAEGLRYLHHYAKPTIIHRDVKSDNILLDENLQAKVSDFGLLKDIAVDAGVGTHATRKVAGTPGYIDPQYSYSQQVTYKSDVYSFGVVLLELITGQDALLDDPAGDPEEPQRITLASFAKRYLNNDVGEIADPKLEAKYDAGAMAALASVAGSCLARMGQNRPSMRDVVARLAQIQATLRGESLTNTHYEEEPEAPIVHKFGWLNSSSSSQNSNPSAFVPPVSDSWHKLR